MGVTGGHRGLMHFDMIQNLATVVQPALVVINATRILFAAFEEKHMTNITWRSNRIIAALLLLLSIMFVSFPALVRAECNAADVWLTFPDSRQVADVNRQLMTDSGPTRDIKTQSITYSRRWQGARFSRSLSITIIIYPTVKMAANKVKSYGKALLKSKGGRKVSLGDLGYCTNQIQRPYFMVQLKRFVVTYYTSYPGRQTGSGRLPKISAQEKTIREILNKIAKLPCFGSNSQPSSSANRCPSVKVSFSPAQPKPTDTIILTAQGTDPDGDKLYYNWRIEDYRDTSIMSRRNTGSRIKWKPPQAGKYTVTVFVWDKSCGSSDKISLPVFIDPNRGNLPPTVIISAKPNPVKTGQLVTFKAVVSDPDGDKITTPRWSPSPMPASRWFENRSGNTFTYKAIFPAGKVLMGFEAADVRGAWANLKLTQIVVLDPNQPLYVKLSSNHPIAQDAEIQENGSITFTAIVNNLTQKPLTYAWSIDGKKKKDWRGPKVTWNFVPYKWSDYRIKVQVWKKNGETASDTINLSVNKAQAPPLPPPTKNSKPTVLLTCLTANPKIGKPVRFKATLSDADPGDKLTWQWRLDGKSVGWSSLTPAWRSSTAGKHSVTITVSDGTDKVSATKNFIVRASPPPPPPVSTTIIKSAEFVDSATSSAWGSIPKNQWQSGEQINLRIDIKLISRSHSLGTIWHDTNGTIQKRTLTTISPNSGWGSGETVWSSLRSSTNDAIGIWTVEILVDGRLDRTLTFKLNLRKKNISPAPPSSLSQPGNRPSRPAPLPPGIGNGGGTPPPASSWKSVL